MEADLAQRPPPPPTATSSSSSSSSALGRVRSRPSSRHAASERGQLDPKLTKWEEWDRYATSMDCDWVVERDMQVFHNALSDEPSNNNHNSSGNDAADQQQPEKIIAASDWAPVKEQRRRRGGGGSSSKPKKRKDVVREGWAYHISRWPLLGLIFLIIFLEFVAYLIVRQSVNTIEFFAGCPSFCSSPCMRKTLWTDSFAAMHQGAESEVDYDTSSETHRRTKRCASANFPVRPSMAFPFGCNELIAVEFLCAQWKRIALELDALLGLNQWKQSAPNAYYDAPLVRRVLKALREFRSRDDVEGVCAVLHACVRNNFAGVESFRLYSESYYGTKNLVQEYLDEGGYPAKRSPFSVAVAAWSLRLTLLLLILQFRARWSTSEARRRPLCLSKRRQTFSAQSPRTSVPPHSASLVALVSLPPPRLKWRAYRVRG